jgi:hypothetical protein
MTGPAIPLKRILAALDKLSIPHAIGGSVASSIHGAPRATSDVDLIVDLRPEQVRTLAAALGPDFYADPDMIVDALLAGRSFNIIDTKTTYKFDFYPLLHDAFRAREMARRVAIRSNVLGEDLEFEITSCEDTILAKLAWFKRGGCVSERQWTDVIGVVRVQAEQLDLAYLREWGPRLGVADLLEEALVEGATRPGAGPHRPEKPSI